MFLLDLNARFCPRLAINSLPNRNVLGSIFNCEFKNTYLNLKKPNWCSDYPNHTEQSKCQCGYNRLEILFRSRASLDAGTFKLFNQLTFSSFVLLPRLWKMPKLTSAPNRQTSPNANPLYVCSISLLWKNFSGCGDLILWSSAWVLEWGLRDDN